MLKRSRAIARALASAAAFWLILAAAAAFADDAPPSDINYRLGDGLHIPGTGLNLGGYATGSYDRLHDETPRLSLENLSLFFWWEGDSRWKFFSELEYDNLVASRTDHDHERRYLSLERLYVDYALTDRLAVRAGKFLTPVGRWNLIHATPLVWTSSRPLVTTRVFPTNMTGLMVSGTVAGIGNGVDYSIYASKGGELRPNPDLDPFSEAIGGHLTFSLSSHTQLGFSYADFEQEKTRPEKKHLVGVDFFWTRNRYEISAEGAYRFSDNGSTFDEKGAFVQAVAPLTQKLYAVGRVELFRMTRQDSYTRLWVAGLNYRVTPALVLKAEWIGSHNNRIGAPDGFMSSISVLL